MFTRNWQLSDLTVIEKSENRLKQPEMINQALPWLFILISTTRRASASYAMIPGQACGSQTMIKTVKKLGMSCLG